MTLNTKIGVFMDFLVILGCETHFKIEVRRNQLRQTRTGWVRNFQHWR